MLARRRHVYRERFVLAPIAHRMKVECHHHRAVAGRWNAGPAAFARRGQDQPARTLGVECHHVPPLNCG
jgi:hypothetical protein